jgi:excinuclease UvrABC ATPase subunit
MAASKQPPADSHDFIRVQGARENNLKDISVEIPKRRLTVFTGVSGSGKSSLVFGTIAAESQRMINETYSAFVQGFMPTLDRPEVDVLEGLTTAIIVDQERLGANSRSTVGTVTDANAMLRVLWSRLGKPHIGSSNAFSFNIPSVRGVGEITIDKGAERKTDKRVFNRAGGMCARCEGMTVRASASKRPCSTTGSASSTSLKCSTSQSKKLLVFSLRARRTHLLRTRSCSAWPTSDSAT